MENKWIFDSFVQWRTYLWKAFVHFFKGVSRIILSVVMGIVSVLVFCGKQIEAFCRREPIAAVVIAIVFACQTAGWTATFVHERHTSVVAQHLADSLSYELSRYTDVYEACPNLKNSDSYAK